MVLSYQFRMSLNRFFNPLRLNADVSLRDRRAAVLQEPLHKGNVIPVVPVYLCSVPFPKAVGADSLIAQIITDKGKLFLYGPCGQGKHQFIAAYAVAQAEILNILIDNKGNSENALFPCFLSGDGKPVSAAVADNIGRALLCLRKEFLLYKVQYNAVYCIKKRDIIH